MKKHLLRFLEVALLIPAFGFLIPPVHSELDQQYPLMPGLAYGATLFSISLTLACLRGGDTWAIAVLKLALFCGLGWLIHERVWM